jgi:hypothetical protein
MTTTTPDDRAVLRAGSSTEDRRERLVAGADRLAGERRSLLRHPQLLVALAGIVMAIGLLAIVLGWVGASRSTILEEQVPYLISGGLLGVALSTIGALLLFSHWLTVGIREAREREAARRADHLELLQALRAAAGTGANGNRDGEGGDSGDGGARGTRAARPVRRAPRRS